MKQVCAMVPPPLASKIEEFEETEGYENQSQAVRELLRRAVTDYPSQR